MNKTTAIINTRVKPELKEQFEYIVSKLGLTPSAAINLYICSVVRNKGMHWICFLKTNLTKKLLRLWMTP